MPASRLLTLTLTQTQTLALTLTLTLTSPSLLRRGEHPACSPGPRAPPAPASNRGTPPKPAPKAAGSNKDAAKGGAKDGAKGGAKGGRISRGSKELVARGASAAEAGEVAEVAEVEVAEVAVKVDGGRPEGPKSPTTLRARWRRFSSSSFSSSSRR
jgi:hypothetical protein